MLKHAGNHFQMNKLFRELQEFQANQFMYHFCVPTFMLLQMELPQWRSQALATIAAVFRVTKEFADKRLDMFERRKAGIQFQKRLAYLLSHKLVHMRTRKAISSTCRSLRKKRYIILAKTSDQIRAEDIFLSPEENLTFRHCGNCIMQPHGRRFKMRRRCERNRSRDIPEFTPVVKGFPMCPSSL